MKTLIPLLLTFTASASEVIFGSPDNDRYEAGIHLFGYSRHYKDRENINNQNNYGIGGQFDYYIRQDTYWYVGPMAAVGVYKDSMSNTASYALAGMSALYGDPEKWHTYLNFGFGYYQGSGFAGTGGMLSLGVGYKWFNIEGTRTPEMAAIWAKIRVWHE
jgi:hypothetical protein